MIHWVSGNPNVGLAFTFAMPTFSSQAAALPESSPRKMRKNRWYGIDVVVFNHQTWWTMWVLYGVIYGFIWFYMGFIWLYMNHQELWEKMVFNQQTWWTNADLTTQKGWKKQWLNHPQTMISIINGGLRVHFLGPPIVPLLKTRPVLLDRWCSIFGPHPHKVWEGQEWSVRMFALRILFHIQLLYAIIVIRVKKTRAYIILYIMYIDLV